MGAEMSFRALWQTLRDLTRLRILVLVEVKKGISIFRETWLALRSQFVISKKRDGRFPRNPRRACMPQNH
jgi:hypothetical protein